MSAWSKESIPKERQVSIKVEISFSDWVFSSHLQTPYTSWERENVGKSSICFITLIYSFCILLTKVSEQIKRHFYLDILKIQIESVPIFQC